MIIPVTPNTETTPEELRDMFMRGWAIDDIAQELGTSMNHVKKLVNEHLPGFNLPGWRSPRDMWTKGGKKVSDA